ncbi:hypothetical protein SUGI_0424050 [Cryptomeria japonica]|nr:hypothetical protein SUGI_0424050 [Cryptomeria japonica]
MNDWLRKEGNQISQIWAVSITSRTHAFASGANCVVLGSNDPKPSISNWRTQQIQQQNRFEPLRKPTKGFLKPSNGRGFRGKGKLEPQMGQVNWRPRAKFNSTPSHKHDRNSLRAATKNQNTANISRDTIEITENVHSKVLRDYCSKHGLFAKWCGNDQPISAIAKWWRETFDGQDVQEQDILTRNNHDMDHIMETERNKEDQRHIENCQNMDPILDTERNNEEVQRPTKDDVNYIDVIDLHPEVEGMNEEEEKEFLINDKIKLQEEENRIVPTNTPNKK